MESVWDKIEQCEKRLNEMECNSSGVTQLDQVDSAMHSNTLKILSSACVCLINFHTSSAEVISQQLEF